MLSANLLSDWRRALASEFQTAYPTAEVVSGRRAGVSRERMRIAVFVEGYQEVPGRVVVANPVLVVRLWPRRAKLGAPDTPADPTELEQLAYDVMRLLQDRQKEIESAVDDLWYFRVQSVTIDEDPEEWGVQVRLVGFARNVATVS